MDGRAPGEGSRACVVKLGGCFRTLGPLMETTMLMQLM